MLATLATAALQLFEPSAPVPVEVVEPAGTGVLAEAYAQIRPVLLATLISVAIVVLGFIANSARVLGPQAFDWLRQHIKDAGARSALDLIERASAAGVDAMEQTMVGRLRAMEPVGILDAGQRRQVFEGALDAARSHVGPEMWADAARKLNVTPERVIELLGTTIEAINRRRKDARGVAGVLISSDANTAPIDVSTGPSASTTTELPATAPPRGVDTVRRG